MTTTTSLPGNTTIQTTRHAGNACGATAVGLATPTFLVGTAQPSSVLLQIIWTIHRCHSFAAGKESTMEIDRGPSIGGCTLSVELICDCYPKKRPWLVQKIVYEPIVDGVAQLGDFAVAANKPGVPYEHRAEGVSSLYCKHCHMNLEINRAGMLMLLQGLVDQVGRGRHVCLTLRFVENYYCQGQRRR
jgi:hypothetical protein